MKNSIQKFFLLFNLTAGLCIQISSPGQSSNPAKATDWYRSMKWLNGLALRPHESVNREELERQYKTNPQWWDKAFAFLKDTKLDSLKPGKYPIDGDNVFATVTEGPTKDTAQTKWEAHRLYLDIHYVISGKEMIGITPVSSASVIIPYDSVKDIGFFAAAGRYYESDKHIFFIAFPQDAHRPGIKVDGYPTEKKIVIKIRTAM